MAKLELTPEKRLLLAFALSFVILLLSRPLLVRTPPPAAEKKPAPQAAAPAAAPAAQVKAPEQPPVPAPAGEVAGESEQTITVSGDLYRVVFSTRGAVVKSWTLKGYRDQEGNPLELTNPPAAGKFGEPFSFWSSDAAARQEANGALYAASSTGEIRAPATLTFEYSRGKVAARKQFTFARDSYVVAIETALASDGKPVPHALAWRGGFGDAHDIARLRVPAKVFYREGEKMVRIAPGDLEGEESSVSGSFPFAGIEDGFFAAAFLPREGPLRVGWFREEMLLPGSDEPIPSLGVAVGGADGAGGRLRLYVGPKDLDVLPRVDPKLADLIDYGWFAFVAKPLFLGMRWIHDHVVSNYGWSIILLTVFINFALFPLKVKGLRSSMKMQKLQPQLRAIQDRYKNLKMNDPRKQDMGRETMELYKKHGVNPVGGCLPMLLQIPFLYGFYKVLVVSIEMRQAPWILWVSDLSSPEPITVKLLPLLMCGTQFLLQKLSPATSPDPMQQKIMMFMPLMMLFFFWNLSSGLVLYWLTGNVVGILQQWYLNRTEIQTAAVESARKKVKATGKK